ncbi:MAG: TIGR00180 family glycosyltransferase, partial [Candidatus Altiarchaeota archaeon]|nr:TIGR00180 family glycosyltransferase [Candidatus Altiarchaeota archaeon]
MTVCSIVIPTHNRPAYLRRILTYFNQYGKEFRIIVADSSLDENKKRNKEIISSLPELNILYINNYPSDIYPYTKIANAIDYVDTKYCVICADDDFLTPNGINQSVDFLEKNPEFTIAQGYNIPFWLETNKENKPVFCWTPIHLCESITFPDVVSRFLFYFSESPFATFYCVHRTFFLKMIFKETVKFTDEVRFGESLVDMLTVIYGKMKRLDVLYSARDAGSISGKWPNILDLKKDRIYDERYARFKECSATHLSKNSQLSIEESKDLIDKAMSNYIK